MALTRCFIHRLLASTLSIVDRAGDLIRDITVSGKLNTIDKGVADFQTEADRKSQRMIVSSLASKFPKLTIVGEEDLESDDKLDKELLIEEESYDQFERHNVSSKLENFYGKIREEDVTVWVDPLDGTSEFVSGNLDHVTVLIGFSYKGKPFAGVVHQPFHGCANKGMIDVANMKSYGRTVWGGRDLGCFGLEQSVSKLDADFKNNLVITTTQSHPSKTVTKTIDAMRPKEIMRVGGAGFKVLLVLEGKAHAYVFASSGSKRWDTCGPEGLLEGIPGGILTNIEGQRMNYEFRDDNNYLNDKGVLACVGKDKFDYLINLVPEEVKKSLGRKDSSNL